MLTIPAFSENTAKIVGIDPGTETLGVAIITFRIDDFKIVRCEAETFIGSNLLSNQWTGQLHGDRYRRIEAHRFNLSTFFLNERPLIIGCESPFIKRRFPQAGLALTEVVCAIRAAVRCYDIWKPLYTITPPEAKRAVGASGSAKKEEVKEAVLKIDELTSTAFTPIANLDEHSIDSLAIAYCLLKQLMSSTLEPLYT